MSKPTVESLVGIWLKDLVLHGVGYVTSHEVEVDLPGWAELNYRVVATPGTFARKWRLARRAGFPGLTLEDASKQFPERTEKTWRLVTLN
jgi:hypothetical protein